MSLNKLQVSPDVDLPDLNLPALERLVISHNQLEQLPARLLLPKLERLDLSNNNFVALPRIDPKELPRLKHLDMGANDLRDIVADTVGLWGAGCTLESLDVKGNGRLLVPQPQIIDRGGKAVWQFFMDLIALCHKLVRRECLLNAVIMAGGCVGIYCCPYCCC